MPATFTVEQIKTWVANDFKKTYVRPLNGKNDTLNKNEYMIAFRVSSSPSYEFHFWKKDSITGEWWEKMNAYAPRKLGKINPDSDSNWIYYTYYYGVKIAERKYDSRTLYIAVKRSFWTTTFN